ncbi:sigma-54 dependent transcriptional regulator [Akkermansiaceae bacterium]|nr:sigma-54 dependent transcriptional regulator [Akkermansiaceae bacterium]
MAEGTSNDEHTILLVDPDLDYLEWATKHLAAEGIKILRCDVADKALQVIEKAEIDLVIADLKLDPFSGLELLGQIKATSPETIVILTAGFPSTTQIIESTQRGAHDVLRKESLSFEIRHVVEAAFQTIDQRRGAGQRGDDKPGLEGKNTIIGVSRPLQDVMKIVGRVARSDAPILVTGESGTGKELIAKSIHEFSPRSKNEMLVINCGAIPDNLLESELFGHEKGSFTGAIARRSGRFEDSHESTLFLDEVGDLPGSVQVKLLRVLQDGTFSRVGSNETLHSDVRIVTATNKDLAAEVTAGRFREDLYYRLNVVEIELPPLRARQEDVPLLAEFFLNRIARRNGTARLRLSGEAMEHLQKHTWPGNVRELENTMARACALSSSDVLLPADIPIGKGPLSGSENIDEALSLLIETATRTGGNALGFARDELIRYALDQSADDTKDAAKLLGISPATLKKWSPSVTDV